MTNVEYIPAVRGSRLELTVAGGGGTAQKIEMRLQIQALTSLAQLRTHSHTHAIGRPVRRARGTEETARSHW